MIKLSSILLTPILMLICIGNKSSAADQCLDVFIDEPGLELTLNGNGEIVNPDQIQMKKLARLGVTPEIFKPNEILPRYRYFTRGNVPRKIRIQKAQPLNDPGAIWPFLSASYHESSRPVIISGNNFYSQIRSMTLLREIQQHLGPEGEVSFSTYFAQDNEAIPSRFKNDDSTGKPKYTIQSDYFTWHIMNHFFPDKTLSTISKEYLWQTLNAMFDILKRTGRRGLNYQLWPIQILIRWKNGGPGRDVARFHTDSNPLTASVALVGHGSEALYAEGTDLQLNVTGQGDMIFFNKHVLHRASSNESGPRLVVLLFFDGNLTKTYK